MNNLPAGWANARLADLGKWCGGGTPSKSRAEFWVDGTIPWVSPKDMKVLLIADAEDHITDAAVSASATNVVPAGSVLAVTRSGILRRKLPVAVTTSTVAINQDLKALKPATGINPRYIAWYLRSDERSILHDCTKDGTTVDSIDFPALLKREIPIAPYAEQERIIAAIEEHFSRIDAGVTSLERVRQNLSRMRQSLLASACSGRLTANWRANNENGSSGTGLLAQLIAEQCARTRGKMKKAISPESALIPDLPSTWTHASIDQVCSFVTDGEHITPPRTSSGVMLLSARNVQNGFLSYDIVDYITEDTYAKLARRLEVCEGDVLLSCSGSVGRSALAPSGARFALVRSVAVLRPLRQMGAFISLMLRSPQLQSQINTRKTQTAQANIFQGQIRSLTLPLPPQDEQAVIVKELERQLALIDDLEMVLNREGLRFATLRSSILASAFSGQLAPQDPSDEPAAVLLRQIIDERESSKVHKATQARKPRAPREKITA